MRPFAYERATTAGAARAAHTGDAAYLGGGTNLVDLMRLGVAVPDRLIDVSGLAHDRIERRDDGAIVIGAGVRNSDLAADRTVRAELPVLSQAVLAGASGQIRNQATTGGNLLQRTRCPYFQDVTKPCNKREPGSGCAARDGENHNHAILGHTLTCVATHPSDMAVALTALDASVHLHGRDPLPLAELYRLPHDDASRDTTLAPGDLITAVEVPPPGMPSAYRKVRERASYAFALVSAAVALDVADGAVRGCRIALGGVAHRPWRAYRAERLLTGMPATEESFRRAALAEMENAEPLRDNGYKVPLTANLVCRTLSDLASGEGGRP
ncbi:FAD binding domain-containing protein [Actinomadura parmotrematis]|uniref:Xanthine dehydrogenase family protein subunit M n=1 Tax=Actinomadura parmotrematis TaxID=2864039 RepID=A0ABS7G432_9ACTN|nr:xanthine dehydrogenase family protein subunit M [Actinomadura parmotrematis]MBW8486609.1 xanthine dehydrogenase family protein subunit M [Actinomadura parmotrematis]